MRACPDIMSLEMATVANVMRGASQAEAEAIRAVCDETIARRKRSAKASLLAFAQELIPSLYSIEDSTPTYHRGYISYWCRDCPPVAWSYDDPLPKFWATAALRRSPTSGEISEMPFTLETHRKIVAFIRGQ